MTADCDRLSAFLDGELTDTEAKEIEHTLAVDTQLRAEFTQLVIADALARQEFAAMLEQPASAQLIDAIRRTPMAKPR